MGFPLSNPSLLHVTRPYANVEEYIAAEAWTLDTRSMLLLDEQELAPDTMITIVVTLGDGSRPIKAEARVLGSVGPKDGRPGGLRLRFKRYGAPTKAIIERAMAHVASGVGDPVTAAAPEPSSPEPSVVELSAPNASPAPLEPPAAAPVELAPAPDPNGSFRPVAITPSGSPNAGAGLSSLRARNAAQPETPSNREYLLEKLRQRGQTEDATMRFQRA
jgi:hypothetical protein